MNDHFRRISTMKWMLTFDPAGNLTNEHTRNISLSTDAVITLVRRLNCREHCLLLAVECTIIYRKRTALYRVRTILLSRRVNVMSILLAFIRDIKRNTKIKDKTVCKSGCKWRSIVRITHVVLPVSLIVVS